MTLNHIGQHNLRAYLPHRTYKIKIQFDFVVDPKTFNKKEEKDG